MNGILLIDKPSGWTSSDVVAKLRGVLHERRVGHAGTLDPLATGLLVVFVGRATRAAEFAESQDKRYRAGLRLGLSTDTQDITGRVLEERPVTVTEEQLEAALAAFQGEQEQIPPMYSAIKIKGQKLYEIARRGGSVERKPRRIAVHELRLCGREGEDFLLDIHCSKGTYVRTLCHDIGAFLGCGGCMSSLRRTAAGDFSLDRAYTLEQVIAAADRGEAEALLLPVDSLFANFPALTTDAKGERQIRNGCPIQAPGAAGGLCRVYSPSGDFLALGQGERGSVRVIKSFFEV